MAEEVVVKEPLTPEMLESGWELAKALTDKQIELSACFWLYTAETNRWKLVMSFPQVDTEGPSKAYGIIQSVIRPEGFRQFEPQSFGRLVTLYLDDISVMSASHPLVRSVASIQMDAHELGSRQKSTRIGQVFVEDAFIYNLSRLTASA